MKKIILYTFLTIIYFLVSCSSKLKGNHRDSAKVELTNKVLNLKETDVTLLSNNTTLEPKFDSLYKLIQDLPEVKELREKIKSSDSKIEILYDSLRTDAPDYYWFEVGIDNVSTFHTVYNFLVSKRTLKVSYYDTSDDSIVSVKTWRSKRGW